MSHRFLTAASVPTIHDRGCAVVAGPRRRPAGAERRDEKLDGPADARRQAGPARGVWDYRTITPLERPVALGTKAFFTDEEAAKF